MKTKTKLPKKKVLTKVERRMRVIKDAIAQIKQKIFIAKAGDYVEFTGKFRKKLFDESELDLIQPEESMQKVLKDMPVKSCEVCAQGAIFLSFIRMENKVTVEDTVYVGGSDEITEMTKNLFDPDQLYKMEQYFEICKNRFVIYDWYREQPIFKKSYKRRPSDELIEKKEDLRLLAILENMVKNNGLFKP